MPHSTISLFTETLKQKLWSILINSGITAIDHLNTIVYCEAAWFAFISICSESLLEMDLNCNTIFTLRSQLFACCRILFDMLQQINMLFSRLLSYRQHCDHAKEVCMSWPKLKCGNRMTICNIVTVPLLNVRNCLIKARTT